MKASFVSRKRRKKGSATVELAVCLPLITLLCLSAIEVSSKIFLQEALTQAAYEGALVAARKGSTASKAQGQVNAILTARNVRNFTTTFNPSAVDAVPPGTPITITVTAPVSNNSLLPGQMYPRSTLSSQLTFVKEEL